MCQVQIYCNELNPGKYSDDEHINQAFYTMDQYDYNKIVDILNQNGKNTYLSSFK